MRSGSLATISLEFVTMKTLGHLMYASVLLCAIAPVALADDQNPQRKDGCIGINCGPDSPPPQPKPRKDGCIGPNCGPDGPPPQPKPRKDGCIGVNCGPDSPAPDKKR